MKKIFTILTFFILSIAFVMAIPEFKSASANGKAVVNVPAHAVEIAPGLYDLGKTFDAQSGKVVQGYAIYKYKGVYARGGVPGRPGSGGGSGTSSCYTFLAKDAKWKGTPESYIVDTDNLDGLGDSFVRSNLAYDLQKWEDASSYNILGNEVAGVVDGADTSSTDGKNEVYFADVGSDGAIAVTIVWGIFYGPPQGRELVEWDQVYDDVDFEWTENALIETAKMDFESIATHELGHSVGLGDLYDSVCSEMTMYGYGSEGETKARTLEDGDINGINKLY